MDIKRRINRKKAEIYIAKQDQHLQQKIDHEIRMRDGTAKLLAASKHPQQMLEAAKNLLTSNARMLSYMGELQKRKTDEVLKREFPEDGNQVPCKAKISVSDIRIPLMWKDAEHFRSKGDHRRYAAFCIVKLGTEIYDTSLLKDIDRTMTDVMFDDVICFDDITPDFEVKLEIYCHRCQDDLSVASTPKRIRKKIEDFGNSVGRTVGRRLSGLKDDSDPNMIIGPKFECIGVGTLKLAHVTDSVGTFDLDMDADTSGTELPLFGNFCCRLAAQPLCLIQDTISGQLYLQDPGTLAWKLYWCRLRNLAVSCWPKREFVDIHAPEIVIPVTKTTQVSEVPASLCKKPNCIQITSQTFVGRVSYNMAALDAADKVKWWDAIYQHLLDQVMWLQACETMMDIRAVTPRRHSVYRRKGLSLYDDTSVQDSSSPMTKMLNRLNIPEQREEEALAESSNQSKDSDSKVVEAKVTETTDIDSASDTHSITEISVVDAERPKEPTDSSTSDKLDRVSQTSSISVSSMEMSMSTLESSSEEVPKINLEKSPANPEIVSDSSLDSQSTCDEVPLEKSENVPTESASRVDVTELTCTDSDVRERTESETSVDRPAISDSCLPEPEKGASRSEVLDDPAQADSSSQAPEGNEVSIETKLLPDSSAQAPEGNEVLTDTKLLPDSSAQTPEGNEVPTETKLLPDSSAQTPEGNEVATETKLLLDSNQEPEIMEEKLLVSASEATEEHTTDITEPNADIIQVERSEPSDTEESITGKEKLTEDLVEVSTLESPVEETPMDIKQDSSDVQPGIPETDNVFSTRETPEENTDVDGSKSDTAPEMEAESKNLTTSSETSEPNDPEMVVTTSEMFDSAESPQADTDLTEIYPDSEGTDSTKLTTAQDPTPLPARECSPTVEIGTVQTDTDPREDVSENLVSPVESGDDKCHSRSESPSSVESTKCEQQESATATIQDSGDERSVENTGSTSEITDQTIVDDSNSGNTPDDREPSKDQSDERMTSITEEQTIDQSEETTHATSPDQVPQINEDAPSEDDPMDIAEKSIVRSLEDLVPTSYDADEVSPGNQSVDEVCDSAVESSGTFDASNVSESAPASDPVQEAGPSTQPTANGATPTAKTTPSSGKKSRKRNRNKNKKKKGQKGGNKETSI